MNTFRALVRDQTGASTAEYAVLLALIVVGLIGAIELLRAEIDAAFSHAASGIGNAK
jgi:Flp pilus assembly pilin Flp